MAKVNVPTEAATAAVPRVDNSLVARFAALEAENAALKAANVDAAGGPKAEFPTAVYRKVPKSDRWPNGYETKRVNTPEARAALGKLWVDSPADL